MTEILSIKGLHVVVEGKEILRGLDLSINAGEIHALMGPNGSGKSTLSYVLAGHERYQVTDGEIIYRGENLLDLAIEARAAKGIFLAFQYPLEIPGVSTMSFLKTALNSVRRHRSDKEINSVGFLKLIREKAKLLEIDDKMLQRPVNVGFSGGEKKRNEVLQMALLEPVLAVLDETDSGLDIDALGIVSKGVNALRSPNRAAIVITHYQRLLSHIVPDFVHVLAEGCIVASGGKELALELEEKGYAMLGFGDEENSATAAA